jgi:hypothetical protein
MKRGGWIIAAAAVFLMACGSLPDLSRMERGETFASGDFLLEITEGENGREVTLAGWTADKKKRAQIPQKIQKLTVTAIGKGAFADRPSLEEVVIPAGVTRIAAGAFGGAPALKKITVHKKNARFVSIAGILYDRDSLDKVCYPAAKSGFDYDLVRQDGESYALRVSGYLGDKAHMVIPGKVRGCPVIGIADRAFADLDFLKRVTLPRYLETMGADVFEKCLLLEKFVLPSGNTNYKIIERDLYDARTGKLVWYPEAQAYFTYKTLGTSAGGTGEMRYIVITGAGTEKKKAAIPPKLNGIRVNEIASGAFEENPALTEIDIPDSIFRMGARAFAFSPKLTKVTLGNNCATIPARAFYECTALQEIAIPDGVTAIADNAFSDCTALERVTLGRRLTTVENSVFSGCSALTEVFIPERVAAIGENAFAGCRTLQNIHVDEKNGNFADLDGVLFNKAKTVLLRFPEGRPEKQYTVPDRVDQIGVAAFSFCQRLSTIGLPETLTAIGNNAFFYCTALYNIRLGAAVLTIGNDAFSGCSSLNEITFPDGLLSIGERAFASCRALQRVAVPRTVASIGDNAFRSCDRLTQVSLSRKTDAPPAAFATPPAAIIYID